MENSPSEYLRNVSSPEGNTNSHFLLVKISRKCKPGTKCGRWYSVIDWSSGTTVQTWDKVWLLNYKPGTKCGYKINLLLELVPRAQYRIGALAHTWISQNVLFCSLTLIDWFSSPRSFWDFFFFFFWMISSCQNIICIKFIRQSRTLFSIQFPPKCWLNAVVFPAGEVQTWFTLCKSKKKTLVSCTSMHIWWWILWLTALYASHKIAPKPGVTQYYFLWTLPTCTQYC